MSYPRRPARPAPSGTRGFDERLSVPWWWWLAALGVVLLVAFQVWLGHPGVPVWLPVALVAPLTAWALIRLGSARVTLTDDGHGERTLRVGPARLPVRLVDSAQRIDRPAKQAALGPDLDPAAFVLHRAWIGPMVRVVLADPRDPTPYWLFSSRQASRLAELLRPTRAD